MAILRVTNKKFIEKDELKQMIAYKDFPKSKGEQKKVKTSLLDDIVEGIGDKWYRLKEGTRQVCDEICFLGSDKGFSFAGAEYLSEKCGVNEKTVRNIFKELVEIGKVIKLPRRSTKHNGKGKSVYLFVNHPYFNYWIKLLGLEFESDCQADCQAENAEIPCESKEKEEEKVPTYSLPIYPNTIYSVYDDMRTNSSKHNEKSIRVIISNFWESVKNHLPKRSFKAVLRKVVDKYNQGKVGSFRDYLATSLANQIRDNETRRIKDKAKRDMKREKKAEPVIVNKRPDIEFGAWLYS